MDLAPITYQPIGVIRSPFSNLVGMPVQSAVPAGGGHARGCGRWVMRRWWLATDHASSSRAQKGCQP